MFIFKRKKQKGSAKNETCVNSLIPCLSGKEIFEKPALKALYIEIKSLISCPKDIYSQIYATTLERLAEFCQAMPFSEHEWNGDFGLLLRQLRITITALKLRRGMLLPKNAPIEIIAAEEAKWTYAIFSAALLYEISSIAKDREITLHHKNEDKAGMWSPLSGSLYEKGLYYKLTYIPNVDVKCNSTLMAAIAGRIIPVVAIRWLSENNELFSLWWETIINEAKPSNEFMMLIDKAMEKAGIRSNTKVDDTKTILEPYLEKLIEWLDVSFSSSADSIFRIEKGLFISEISIDIFISTVSHSKQVLIKTLIDKEWLIMNGVNTYYLLSPKKFEDQRTLRGIILNIELLSDVLKKLPLNTNFIENRSL